MRALILGATGFLGGHLLSRLCSDGHALRVLVRDKARLVRSPSCDVEVRVGDLADEEAIRAAVTGVDVVFHAAGSVSFWRGDRERLYEEHVRGTGFVVDACQSLGARLVYTSSVAALGRPRPDGSVGDEDTPFDWDRTIFTYAAAKHDAERLVCDGVRKGLDAVTVIPATTFGSHDVNLSAARFIADLDAGRLLGYPNGGLTIAHATSVAEGHLLAAKHGRSGQRYVLGGEHLSYRKIFEEIARCLDRRPPMIPIARPLLRSLGRVGDCASALLRRDLGLNRATATLSQYHLYYSSEKAVSELGYSARPAADAIRQACAWYQHERSFGVER